MLAANRTSAGSTANSGFPRRRTAQPAQLEVDQSSMLQMTVTAILSWLGLRWSSRMIQFLQALEQRLGSQPQLACQLVD